jgi:hypothetical protein
MVDAGRGRRLEHHAVHLRRDRPDIGNFAEGRRRIARIEKALQELEPRRPAGDLRRHKPELATRMRMALRSPVTISVSFKPFEGSGTDR